MRSKKTELKKVNEKKLKNFKKVVDTKMKF